MTNKKVPVGLHETWGIPKPNDLGRITTSGHNFKDLNGGLPRVGHGDGFSKSAYDLRQPLPKTRHIK